MQRVSMRAGLGAQICMAVLLVVLCATVESHRGHHTQFRGDGCRATGDVVVRENGRFEGRRGGADADTSAWAPATDAPAVRSHVSSLGAPRYVELSETHFSCVDGRYPQGVVTTAGGDAAEFMLALTVAKLFGAPVDSQRAVSDLFAAFLDYSPSTRRFYMHSDTQAHARLCRKLGLFDGPECDSFSVRHAQPDMQEVLRFQLVANVSHIGCEHIRALLLDSRAYGTTRPLVERFLTAFFEYMWAVDSKRPQEQQRLIYSVLQHEHHERAVLEISSLGCADSFVPLVPSITAEEQFFIHHVGANRMLHEEFAEFFNRKYPSVISDRAAFVTLMAEMYNRQLDLTLGSLAAGLANFEVEISGEPDVTSPTESNAHPMPSVPKTVAPIVPTASPSVGKDDDDDEDGIDSQLEAVIDRSHASAREPPRARRDMQLVETDSTESVVSASLQLQRAAHHARLEQSQHLRHAHQHAHSGAHRAMFHAAETSLRAAHPRGLEQSLIERSATQVRTKVPHDSRRRDQVSHAQEESPSALETSSHLHHENFMRDRHVARHLELVDSGALLKHWHSADNEDSHVVHHVPMA